MNIFFIVGFWNSGTTLLTDVMRQHPDLKLRRAKYKPNLEERDIVKILNKLGKDYLFFDTYYEKVQYDGFSYYEEPNFTTEEAIQFRKLFDKKFKVRADKTLLIKNPRLFFLPNFLDKNFENDQVKQVIILRNSASQVPSKDYWLRAQNPEKLLFARAHFWVRCMEYYFENWYQKENVLTIRYENLCQKPDKTIATVCDFLEKPYEPIAKKIPEGFEVRMNKWNNLLPEQQATILKITNPMQIKIDAAFPVF